LEMLAKLGEQIYQGELATEKAVANLN